MNKIREIQRLNKIELEQGVSPSASWHTDYRHTAYIYFGGLPFDLTEGDVITIFSQFGEPTFVKLVRDKVTGKSRGFGWLKYEDQRSCDLAVDNLAGATVLNRMISVDHAEYKRRDDEEDEPENDLKSKMSSDQRAGDRHDRQESPESEQERPKRKLLPEEMELLKLIAEHDDEDPMKGYLIDEKKKEIEEALARQHETEERQEGTERRRHRRRRRDSDARTDRERDEIDDHRRRGRRVADDRELRRRSRSDERTFRDRQRYRHDDIHRSASPNNHNERSRHGRRNRSRSSSDDGGRKRHARRERSSDKNGDSNGRRRRA